MKKRLSKIFIVIFLATICFAGGLFLWIATAPRSIPYLAEKIEDEINVLSPDFQIKIGEIVVFWEDFDNGIGVHVKKLSIVNSLKEQIAYFPDITIQPRNILSGNVKIREVTIESPKFYAKIFPRKDNKVIAVSGSITRYQQVIKELLSGLELNGNNIPVDNIVMKNVSFGINDVKWYFPEVSMQFILVGNVVTIRTTIDSYINQNESKVVVYATLSDQKELRIRGEFHDIDPVIAENLFPKLSWLHELEMLLDGNITFILNEKGKLDFSDFNISIQNVDIKISGSMDIHEKYPDVYLKIITNNLSTEDLYKYWPSVYVPLTREWITSRITKGIYKKALIEIDLTPEYFVTKKFTENSIKVMVEFDGATIDYAAKEYSSKFPLLENASGIAKINYNSVDLLINNADMDNLRIPVSQINILNMDDKNKMRMKLDGQITGKIEDAVPYINNQKVNKINDVTGDFKANLILEFPLIKGVKWSDVKTDISAQLSNVYMPDVIPKVDINDGAGILKFSDQIITIDGAAFFNKTHANITYFQDLAKKEKTKYTFRSAMTPTEMAGFGLPEISFVDGAMELDLLITDTESGKNIVGKIDGKDTIIDATAIGWKKEKDTDITLSFVLDYDIGGKLFDITGFQIIADGFIASGTAKFPTEKEKYCNINFENVSFGNNDLGLNILYKSLDDANYYTLDIKGKSIDISSALTNHKKKPDKTKDLVLNMNVDVDRMLIANNIKMSNVAGNVQCGVEKCLSVVFKGDFTDGGFTTVSLDHNILSVKSDNAGAFTTGFNILPNVKGGYLEISAESEKNYSFSKGKMIMKNFKIIKTPILAKLFTLGSFTGIIELLDGKGISFKKLKGEFSIKNKVITFDAIKASGDSIGITANGNVNIKESTINMHGAVIPAYTINNFVGKIPLVGQLLIGKEGEGIIATRYKIKGELSKPDVTVNPLSMLTPGFLRLIWGEN